MVGVGAEVVVGAVHGDVFGAQTLPGSEGGVQRQSATSAQPSSVLTHAFRFGIHQYTQLPPQPAGGGSGGGWEPKTQSVWAVEQYGSPAGDGHGHRALQPLDTRRQDQVPSVPGTPIQLQPVWQSTPAGVVVVLQSHVVDVVSVVNVQSGG